jgi:crotonobetainyl-CoA:carnitine CoA-transferase CaiB-like acyl-CoA transferase
MLQGMMPYEQGAMIGRQFPERFGAMYPEMPPNEPPMPTLHYHPAQAGDGRWLQFGNLLPHLFDNFLMVTDLIDIIADPDFEPTQLALPPEKYEPFRDRMLRRLQDRPAADWISDCVANGSVVAATYQTTQDALRDPDIVANGHAIDRGDGSIQLGPLARMTKTPAQPGRPCQPDNGWSDRWQADPRPRPKVNDVEELPLAGLRVLEIATIIAAPLGASFLADMGAEVTKIEQINGDPYRGLAMGVGSARVNAGKRSISLNLKSAEGQAIAAKLAAKADVLIHNYRPGVPEKLGIGYDQIAQANPNIVYLQVNGYGPDGPGAQRPSTHPIPGAAMGGVLYQMGERIPEQQQDIPALRTWTRRLMRANELNPDPNTAMVVCSSALLGLNALQRTGKGQRILIDMFGANAYANHDDFLSYPGKAPRAMPDEGLHGLHPSYRLYATAENQWVFLAVPEEKEKKRFAERLTAIGIEVDIAILTRNDETTVGHLSEIFKGKNAEFWEAQLAPQGVGCVRADRYSQVEFWWNDPQVQALNLTQPTEHPAWGAYDRHGANVTFGRRQPKLKPPPTAGQHAEELLAEIGYDSGSIAKLLAQGTIWKE